MKRVLIKLTNGGSLAITLTPEQYISLQSGRGIQTDMYGFIPASSISSYRVV